jgi:hypothetical protein
MPKVWHEGTLNPFSQVNEEKAAIILGIQPGSVAVNHAGLWIPRQQFESAPGYLLYNGIFRS